MFSLLSRCDYTLLNLRYESNYLHYANYCLLTPGLKVPDVNLQIDIFAQFLASSSY